MFLAKDNEQKLFTCRAGAAFCKVCCGEFEPDGKVRTKIQAVIFKCLALSNNKKAKRKFTKVSVNRRVPLNNNNTNTNTNTNNNNNNNNNNKCGV